MATKWKNSTDWSDAFLRRMLSWVCRELECPRKSIRRVEFGNRTTSTYSGRAWFNGRILVRVGPAERFPTKARTHAHGTADEFSVGPIADRLEALVKVTAHEAAHIDNGRRGNLSRRGGDRSWGGSERYTDVRAEKVLDAFRLKRDELVAEWSKQDSPSAKPAVSIVEKRAAHAAVMAAKWERKLKAARTKLAAWKRKVAYYDRRYATAADKATR